MEIRHQRFLTGRKRGSIGLLLLILNSTVGAHPTGAHCVTEATDAARLACFDTAFADTERSPGAGTNQADAAVPEDAFGREQIERKAPLATAPSLTELYAVVTKIRRAAHGHLVFDLDNGQVWMQVTARNRLFKSGERIAVSKASMGGYILKSERGVSTRVKRLR